MGSSSSRSSSINRAFPPPPRYKAPYFQWKPKSRTNTWLRDNCNETVSGYRESNYRGCQNKTKSGKKCQRWDATKPHSHSQMKTNWKKSQMKNPGNSWHNYCRNPDNEPGGIWCYTTDPSKRWEYCDPRTDIPQWQLQKKIDDFIKNGDSTTGKNLQYYTTYGRYIYTYDAAKRKCKEKGLVLCPRDILYKNGKAKRSVCSAGWVQYPDNRGYPMTYRRGGCGGVGWNSWSSNKSSRGSAHCCAGDKKRKADADAAERARKAAAAARRAAAAKAAREAAERARLAKEKAEREAKERARLAAIEAERRRKAEQERLRKLALQQERERLQMKAAMEEMKYIPDPVPPKSYISKKDPERQFPGPQCTINGRTIQDIYPNIKIKNKTCEKGCPKGPQACKAGWDGVNYNCADPKRAFPYNTCTPGKTANCTLNAECLGKEGYECTTKDLCCRKGYNEELDCDLSKKLFKYTKGISRAEWEKKKCTPYDTEYCARRPPCEQKSRWQAGKCD